MAPGIPICFAMMSVACHPAGVPTALACCVEQCWICLSDEPIDAVEFLAGHLMFADAAFSRPRHRRKDICILPQVAWRYWRSGGLAMATVATTAVIAAPGGGGHRYHHDGASCTASYVGPWYDKALATGPVLAGGCLGPIIPPSTIMIMFSYTATLQAGCLPAFTAGYFV